MTPRVSITAAALQRGLVIAAERVCNAREELCELDAAAGDGDLGVTLTAGFGAVRDALQGSAGADLAETFNRVGLALARDAASSLGTLLARGFIRAGKEVEGAHDLSTQEFVRVLRSIAAEVELRGGAGRGQRTILDAMHGGADAASEVARESEDMLTTARSAARGAADGAAATANMEPQVGRAAWVGDRARGRPDGGATAWAIFLGGLADGVADHYQDRGDEMTAADTRERPDR